MGKKVCVEIEYSRILEAEIELPEGKTLDDIRFCKGGSLKPVVEIYFSDSPALHYPHVDPRSKIADLRICENDFKERCHYNIGQTILEDLDTKERVKFS